MDGCWTRNITDDSGVECHSIHSLTSHHGLSHNSQVTFKKDVEALVDAFCDLGNPFREDSDDLTVDTIDIMDEAVVMSIRNIYNTGREQHTLFVQERLYDQKKHISDAIKKNKLLFPKDPGQNGPSSCCSERRLEDGYGASQTREGLTNIEKLEKGRNQTFFNAWRHYILKSKYNVTPDIKPVSSKSNKACNVSLFCPLWRHGTSSISMNE